MGAGVPRSTPELELILERLANFGTSFSTSEFSVRESVNRISQAGLYSEPGTCDGSKSQDKEKVPITFVERANAILTHCENTLYDLQKVEGRLHSIS